MSSYTGRFAPSPSGPLHLGSLVAALASYLDARSHSGTWLVRVEDIDPPREQPGAADRILKTLEAHGLEWDRDILYQSTRLSAYQDALDAMTTSGSVYRCNCNRQRLKTLGGRYDGHCLTSPPAASDACAYRLCLPGSNEDYEDLIQGRVHTHSLGHPVVKRKDGLFSYQLAVVLDDWEQGITDVIRGADLLDTTPNQLSMFDLIRADTPRYGHIPVVNNSEGQKLSKQNHAPALNDQQASNNLKEALTRLGLNLPAELQREAPENIVQWATASWSRSNPTLKLKPAPTALGRNEQMSVQSP